MQERDEDLASAYGENDDLRKEVAAWKDKVRTRDKAIFWLVLVVGYFLLGKIARLIFWLKKIPLPRLLEIILL